VAKASTKRQVQIGLEHLGRFAFETRDNPFVARQAALTFATSHAEDLERLLNGEIEVGEWLETASGDAHLRGIRVGSLPRDVQLLFREGEQVVGVDSVHAFLHARPFWWLVSILWTLSIAQAVDPLLGRGILGFRFRKAFLEDPGSSGLMFADQRAALKRWRELPGEVRKEHAGEFLTTAKLDLRAFYYSIDAGPAEVVETFFAAKGKAAPRSRRLRVLTELLEALHEGYAEQCARVAPRRADLGEEGRRQLPVGLPSSQVLANMVISLVLDEIGGRDGVVAVAAYADDLLVMTETMPQLREAAVPFLSRLGLIEAEAPYELKSPATSELGRLVTSEEKIEVSYGRYLPREDEEEIAAQKAFLERIGISTDDWEDYAELDNDWGGRLTTVLRTAHKRERVPRRLRNDLLGLLDEVRYGLAPEETARRFEEFFGELDRRLLVALRTYWCELIVVAIAARGLKAVSALTDAVREIIETAKLPEGTSRQGYRALSFGLRQSWYQALAQAIAVATDEDDRKQLLEMLPSIKLDKMVRPRPMSATIAHAMRIRRRRLVPSGLVAVPLAEFSDWEGELIGASAFAGFLEWSREQPEGAGLEGLIEEVERSPRFINLHEAGLAVHLWAGEDGEDWLDESFQVLEAQPLVDENLVTELRERAEEALDPAGRPEADLSVEVHPRVGMPSMIVDEGQLTATIEEDTVALGEIAKRSREDLQKVVGDAVRNRVDLLVLPEWALLPQLVPWLMRVVAGEQMLVVAGQVPERAGSVYRNLLWTGIPLTDSAGHRACLPLPPRQKCFLSPREEKAIRDAHLTPAPAGSVQPFNWRGMSIASLICFEFADLSVRRDLRFEADLLTVSSLNHDWHYFDAVQDATSRDNYCLTVCVNTGAFPGTRIVRPTSSEKAVIASVHGSDDPALITRKVDMLPILKALDHHLEPSQAIPGYNPLDGIELDDYKPFPPA